MCFNQLPVRYALSLWSVYCTLDHMFARKLNRGALPATAKVLAPKAARSKRKDKHAHCGHGGRGDRAFGAKTCCHAINPRRRTNTVLINERQRTKSSFDVELFSCVSNHTHKADVNDATNIRRCNATALRRARAFNALPG